MRIIHLIFEVFDECIFIDFVNQGPLTHVGRYRAIEVTVIIIINITRQLWPVTETTVATKLLSSRYDMQL